MLFFVDRDLYYSIEYFTWDAEERSNERFDGALTGLWRMLNIGIEQEFVFADSTGRYLDADNVDYSVFRAIVDGLPIHNGDDEYLYCKSLETYPKRCYVEGFERHDSVGNTIETLPKGLEIRTLPHDNAEGVVTEFRETFAAVMSLASNAGLHPLLTSRHPFKTTLALDKNIGEVERKVRTEQRFALATRAMLSHGMHVTVSLRGASAGKLQDLVAKINYYLPALIPWSFSSPFYQGKAFQGLCCRNYLRAESRRMADVQNRHGVSVLEFRGFDACGDAGLMQAILNLYSGFLLDDSLPGRSREQDPEALKHSSLVGFADPVIRESGLQILRSSEAAMGGKNGPFELLAAMLENNDSYAARMKHRFTQTGSIMECISAQYDF